ncbi:hypothetical protein Tco_1038948 [Tanacetum coccineum]
MDMNVRCTRCEAPSIVRTSWTNTNPGRRFYCCSVRCGIIDLLFWRPIRRIHQGRYGVSVPALTKDPLKNHKNPYAPVIQEDQYGVSRIWYDEDALDLRSIETEFPAIVFNDSLTSNETPSCEPTVSSPNDKIDFISSDESDDEDYTNEFTAIVYNDALTSKSDLSTEPILCPQHIDEFDSKDETSLSGYDEKEQNVLYFNKLFPFNIVHPDNLKSDKGNNENKVDMIQSLGGGENTNKLVEESHDKINKVFIMISFVMELNVNIVTWNHFINGMLFNLIKNLYVPFGIPFDPKRYYKDGDCARMLRRPRYEGLQYTDVDIADFETRLARIYRREIHRVQVFDFGGLPDLMAKGLSARMRMEHRDAQGQEEMQTAGFGLYWTKSVRRIPDKGDLRDYWIGISSAGDFLGTAPSYTFIRDPMLRLCYRIIACSIVGGSQAPEKFASGRKRGDMISEGQYVARLAEHFGLLTEERLQGLTVIALALPIIDMAELVRLQLCVELDDTWAWVPTGPARQERDAGGVAEEDPGQREVLDSMARDFSQFSTWTVTSLARMMDMAGVPYTRYSESPVEYERRTRRRTDGNSTSTAPQQPDP